MTRVVLLVFASWLALALPAAAEATPSRDQLTPKQPDAHWRVRAEVLDTPPSYAPLRPYEPERQFELGLEGPFLGPHKTGRVGVLYRQPLEKREQQPPISRGNGVELRLVGTVRF